ncbi:MAG: L-dopachrome tautomerase-related protein [Bacteroidota bacterium]
MNIRQTLTLGLGVSLLLGCTAPATQSGEAEKAIEEATVGTLETVAELNINPGNVAVSNDGRVFTSIHPMRNPSFQLAERTGEKLVVFPNQDMQTAPDAKTDAGFDTPLGIVFDQQNRLWVIDAGLNLGKTRLFAFDIDSREELMRFDIPQDLAPKSSFVQDVAVDEKNGWVYLADFGNPGIIVVDIAQKSFRKITHLPSMQAEDIDMVIDGKAQLFNGAPARIGINPITLSADRERVFYGPMSGTKWYSLATQPIREGASDEEVLAELKEEGPKPLCDGVATDRAGNHYFTNIQQGSIDRLAPDGQLTTIKQDPRIVWPDNVRLYQDEWLYIAVNQLHKAPAFTGGEDLAEPPFYILRLKVK